MVADVIPKVSIDVRLVLIVVGVSSIYEVQASDCMFPTL